MNAIEWTAARAAQLTQQMHIKNSHGGNMRQTLFADLIARKRAEYGARFDAAELAPQFIPFYENGARIEVQFVDAAGEVYETKRGRVGITTGWRPAFLLILTSRSRGSSYVLRSRDKVAKVVAQ
jgi:hypothetical protein